MAPASAPAWVEHPAELREPPAHAVLCTRPAARLLAEHPAHAPASASAPAWVLAPDLASVPDPAELQAWYRLRAKRRVRSVLQVDTRAVAASSTPSPKKAR